MPSLGDNDGKVNWEIEGWMLDPIAIGDSLQEAARLLDRTTAMDLELSDEQVDSGGGSRSGFLASGNFPTRIRDVQCRHRIPGY